MNISEWDSEYGEHVVPDPARVDLSLADYPNVLALVRHMDEHPGMGMYLDMNSPIRLVFNPTLSKSDSERWDACVEALFLFDAAWPELLDCHAEGWLDRHLVSSVGSS